MSFACGELPFNPSYPLSLCPSRGYWVHFTGFVCFFRGKGSIGEPLTVSQLSQNSLPRTQSDGLKASHCGVIPTFKSTCWRFERVSAPRHPLLGGAVVWIYLLIGIWNSGICIELLRICVFAFDLDIYIMDLVLI
jgi:hypothetical protein